MPSNQPTLFDHITTKDLDDWLVGQSGVVLNTTTHHIEHFIDPVDEEMTLHHLVIGYLPFPNDRERAYRVAYVSIPLAWMHKIPHYKLEELYHKWDVSFEGPAGQIQTLQSSINEYDVMIGSRIYIGWDWRWAEEADNMDIDRVRERVNEFLKACNGLYAAYLHDGVDPLPEIRGE